jgi:hypothetical protein
MRSKKAEIGQFMIRIAVACVCLFVTIYSASAQNAPSPFGSASRPGLGASGTRAPVEGPTIGASSGTEILRHRDPTGSPCLTIGGFARAHVVNPNLYDHVITIRNSCAQRIALQVCYYNTQDCISIDVTGGESKEAILGTLPSTKEFRYEFREKF